MGKTVRRSAYPIRKAPKTAATNTRPAKGTTRASSLGERLTSPRTSAAIQVSRVKPVQATRNNSAIRPPIRRKKRALLPRQEPGWRGPPGSQASFSGHQGGRRGELHRDGIRFIVPSLELVQARSGWE